jgi:F0F1-type ATP synthase epsilon subunit
MANKALIKLKIRDTDSIQYEGEVDRISSYNEMGQFDVYPMHANFISIINKSISLYLHNKLIKKMDIEKAVMKVKKDEAQIFLGIEALLLEEESSFRKINDQG